MRILTRVCLIAALLPYVKTSPLSSDLQPHFALALGLTIATGLALRARFPFSQLALFLSLTLGGTAVLLGGRLDAVALALLPIALSVLSHCQRRDITYAAKVALIVYGIGVILELVMPTILDIFVSNRRAAHARGFTSFTSEPSYLGLVGFALVIVFMVNKQGRAWVCTSGLICLASGSLTAIAPLFAVLLIRMLRPAQAHVFVCVAGLGMVFTIAAAQTDSRIGLLIASVWTNPAALLIDESVSNRIARAFSPLVAAYQSGFVPNRFPQPGMMDVPFTFLAESADSQIERLSSVATVLIYVYGVFSLPLILGYMYIARAPFYVMLALCYFCITNISISTPYLFLLLSLPLSERLIARPRVKGLGLNRHS